MINPKMITPITMTSGGPSEESDATKRAYLYHFKELIEILQLQENAKSRDNISSVKLPTTKRQGTYQWKLDVPTKESIIHLPTPKITNTDIQFLIFDRNDEENKRLAQLSSAFQSVGTVSTKINRTLKSSSSRIAGVYEILNQFTSYHQDLLRAYSSAGFRNRKDFFAKLQLIINLFKRFSQEDFETIKRNALGQDKTLNYFFEEQAWIISCKRLEDSLIDLSRSGINAGNVVTVRNEVQSSALDEPSIIIPISYFLIPASKDAYQRVIDWLREGDTEFYMIKIVTDLDVITAEHIQQIVPNLTAFMTELSKNRVDLLSFLGTNKLHELKYAKTPKLIDVFLKYLIDNPKLLTTLQKLDISENYISYNTFKLLGDVISCTQSLMDINISDLRLGEKHIIKKPMLYPNVSKPPCCFCCVKACSCMWRFMCYPLLCCWPRFCLPKNPQINYEEMNEHVVDRTKVVKAEVAIDVRSVTGGIEILIGAMEKKAAMGKQGRLRSFIAKNFDFSTLGFSTSQVERLFTATARCNPFAVSVKNSHLTDKNVIAAGMIISENPSILHYNLEGTKFSSLDSWNHLQKLTASSFLIVSMPLPQITMQEVVLYHNVSEPGLGSKEWKENIGCCCCNETREEITLKQTVEAVGIQVGPNQETANSIQVVVNAMKNEVTEHRLLPYHKVFTQLFGADPKYLKILKEMMREDSFAEIFSQNIEKEKEAAFQAFKVNMKAKAQEENLISDVNASIMLDYNEMWKIDEGWDELSKVIASPIGKSNISNVSGVNF